MTTWNNRRVSSSRRAGSAAQSSRTACALNWNALTSVTHTAPNAHWYGGSSQEQPVIRAEGPPPW